MRKMSRILRLEQQIGDYRVTAEIDAPAMRVNIAGQAKDVSDEVVCDNASVAREFVEFFNKALAAREMMIKEAEADNLGEEKNIEGSIGYAGSAPMKPASAFRPR